MSQTFNPSDIAMLRTDKRASLTETVQRWKSDGDSVALVPTMGALHEGHLSLVRLALKAADRCVVSIFVNPTQFAPHEDFDSYPRDISADLQLLQSAGVDLVYTPDEADMYPSGKDSAIKAGAAAKGLETDFRPHFFDGVVNVVHRLFDHAQPDLAVFGEKDYQQLMVIDEMVQAQSLPIEITGAPIARDAHGLALSSRNAYLSAEELEIARMLNQALYKAAQDIQGGADADAACDEASALLLNCGFDKVDYVSYKPEWNRVLIAAHIGKTRLIDNAPTTPST